MEYIKDEIVQAIWQILSKNNLSCNITSKLRETSESSQVEVGIDDKQEGKKMKVMIQITDLE